MITQFSGPGEGDVANPLIPAAYDLIWSLGGLVIAAALMAAWALALLSIQRHSDRLPAAATAVWVGIVLLTSVRGAIAWFTIGRPQARRVSAVTSAR